jgi:Ni/Fe-hydrogenase subunit HybB-like protein
MKLPRSPWAYVFWVLMAAGAYATFVRFYYGLGASTNLSDKFPWGIWIGFDVLCGVGLAAGGFTLAATVHIFHLERFKPIVRPAILTAFLGYILVCAALMFDLGRPWRIWHPLIMWNPHSVMFEVGWCVTLYTTVLGLEFLPVVLERFHLVRMMKMLKLIMLPVVILGVLLSTLHQSSLGTLFLIVPNKLHPLWYSPWLPVLFYVSAIAVGLAMTIFESWHSSKAFGRQLEFPIIQKLSQALAVVLAFYLTLRISDLSKRHAWVELTKPGIERWLFLLEMALMVIPAALLFWDGIRLRPRALYLTVTAFLLGFVTHRLNVGVTGMERGSGVSYVPKWTEVAVTLAIIAFGFAAFRFLAQRLPIFPPEEHHDATPSSTSAVAERREALLTGAGD